VPLKHQSINQSINFASLPVVVCNVVFFFFVYIAQVCHLLTFLNFMTNILNCLGKSKTARMGVKGSSKGKNPAKRLKKTPASDLITQAVLTKVSTTLFL